MAATAALPTLEEITIELDRRRSKRSFAEFVKAAWHVLEPETPLVWNWHMQVVCDHLQAIVEGRFLDLGLPNRLLINVPPGTSKSLLVSVLLQAWEWGPAERPARRYLSTSYNDGPVNRDTRKCRDLILSEWYQKRWPVDLVRRAETSFANDNTGTREGTAFGSLTSKRGDVLVIDDPHSTETAESDKDRQTTTRKFRTGAQNRLNNQKKSVIIVIMQRLHEADVSGVIAQVGMDYIHLMLPMEFEPDRACYTPIQTASSTGDGVMARYDAAHQHWYLEGDDIPAERADDLAKVKPRLVYRQDPRTDAGEIIDPVRFPPEEVANLKRDLGSYAYAGQYQQRPVPREGGMFQRSWFTFIKAAPVGTRWVRGWDLAATESDDAAFTAGVKIGRTPEGRYVIAHSVRDQASPGGVERLIKNTASDDGTSVEISMPQDPGQSGKTQKHYYVPRLAGYNIRFSPESGSKEARAEPLSAQAEGGNVDIIKTGDPVKDAWIDPYLEELCMFPNSRFKDQTDASSRAFAALIKPAPPTAQTGQQRRN